jgi:Circularly permutated YpsA SLOG family
MEDSQGHTSEGFFHDLLENRIDCAFPFRPSRDIPKIVSGGQTGADRAELDWALSRGIVCGGWCPKGRKAEDEAIAAKYPLIESKRSGRESSPFCWSTTVLAVARSKAGRLVLVFKLPCAKRYLRYCRLTTFQQMPSDWPRTTLIPWRAREQPLASASA